jgi:hypothetical protein
MDLAFMYLGLQVQKANNQHTADHHTMEDLPSFIKGSQKAEKYRKLILQFSNAAENRKKDCQDPRYSADLSHIRVVLFLVLGSTEEWKAHADCQGNCERQLWGKEAYSGKPKDSKRARSVDHLAATPGLNALNLLLNML